MSLVVNIVATITNLQLS